LLNDFKIKIIDLYSSSEHFIDSTSPVA